MVWYGHKQHGEEEMEHPDVRLSDREVEWLKAYFQSGGNASEATKSVYGGTPLSCRVKGCKRLKRLTPVIEWIFYRGIERMSYEEEEVFWEELAETRG